MRIAMLVSGGVDSSVSLRLLKEAGHDVTAFYLKIWLEDELAYLGDCPWEEDLAYARAVCEQAGVPLEVVPLQKEYWERIVSYTIAEARAGRTPNPDVLCNARIKFGAFYEAVGQGFERIGTGHYARTDVRRGKTRLLRAADPVKDQTYFLSQMTQAQVARAVFPIGHLRKPEVRELAARFALPNAERKDSQGICFLGKIPFDQFLKHHLGERTGDIVDLKTGQKLGEHPGFWFYTIGQRRNIRLSGGPWYVAKKDTGRNIIYVSNAWRSEDAARDVFDVTNLNWIAGVPPRVRDVRVKIRHGEKDAAARLRFVDGGRKVRVKLETPDPGVAPGQFAVFYDGEVALGGGVIV